MLVALLKIGALLKVAYRAIRYGSKLLADVKEVAEAVLAAREAESESGKRISKKELEVIAGHSTDILKVLFPDIFNGKQ